MRIIVAGILAAMLILASKGEQLEPLHSSAEKGGNFACSENDWDEHQYCLCRPGQAIHTLHSEFSSKHEDRRWRLGCKDKGYHYGSTNNWYGSSNLNHFDGDFSWNGVPQFLVGMQSWHKNSKEDREYQVFYTTTTSHSLTNCTGWQKLNTYRGNLDYTLEGFEVITALFSSHDNDEEDREFWIKNCRLKQRPSKCGEMVSIEYDYNKAIVEQEVVSAGTGFLDNTNAQSENTLTVWVTRDFAESHSESYSFGRTSGHETAVKLELSTAVATQVGLPSWLGGASLDIIVTVTSGVTTTWSESQTWTRTESTEYSETNGNKFQFITNCKPGYTCKATILVKSAIASIPYKLTTGTEGTTERCVEEGTLSMAKTFSGQMMVNDTFGAPAITTRPPATTTPKTTTTHKAECVSTDIVPKLKSYETIRRVRKHSDCQERCEEDDSCDYWKWKTNKNWKKRTCWLMRVPKRYMPKFVSGPKKCG